MIITDIDKLRQKCIDVEPHEVDELRNLLQLELEVSEKRGNPGAGLAAPQIGIYKNMAIVRVKPIAIDLVNAKIIKSYGEFVFDGEGCLSFPGVFIKTKRFSEIVVTNNYPYSHSFIATGFASIVIQHELDHLQGILLQDKSVNI